MLASGDRRTLVSIVIPCFDQGRLLGEAIASALAQTRPPREVLVVDDGSADDTPAVARRYPVVYVRQVNRGLAAAKNAGLAIARGRFVVFLDADGRLLPRAVAAGLDAFAAAPGAAFVSGRYRRIAADGAPLDMPDVAPAHATPAGADPYLALLRGNHIGMHATVMYRREALEAAGGFDERLRACEDYDVYLRLARRAPVARHGEVVAESRQHDPAASRDAALMLSTTLAVHAAQAPHAAGDPERRRAYRDGRAVWRAYYGDRLLEEAFADLATPGRRTAAAGKAAVLLRHAPAIAARRLARACMPRA